MIFEGVLSVVFSFVNSVLSPLQKIDISVDMSAAQPFVDFLGMIFYMIPIGKIMPFLIIVFYTMLLRIAISLLRTIWDILPLV